jgi:hypothetical protein
MILLGFDPGVNGAVGAIDHNGDFRGVRDLPTIELPGEGTIRRRLDGLDLTQAIRELVPANEPAIAYVENVQAWGGMAASQLSAMVGAKDSILCILDLFRSRIQIKLVLPHVWKAKLGLRRGKGETTAAFKARSRAEALDRYPNAPITLAAHDGRAEALLIATFGRDKQGFRDDLLAEPRVHAPSVHNDIDSVFGGRAA